jgi:hypothetical protein
VTPCQNQHGFAFLLFHVKHHRAPRPQQRLVIFVGVQVRHHAGDKSRVVDPEFFTPRRAVQLRFRFFNSIWHYTNFRGADV